MKESEWLELFGPYLRDPESLTEEQRAYWDNLCGITETLNSKYGQSGSSWMLLVHLLSLNKYLRLAHYLRRNRMDASDGYNHAREGLRQFSVDTNKDLAIALEITQKLNDETEQMIEYGGIDGRVFSDGDYGYDELFSMAPSDLREDYELLWRAMSVW